MLFNNGTRNQVGFKKAVGFSVINIGVSNLNQTIRTDLANKYYFNIIIKVFNIF